jgi:hypothetical protein
MRNLIVLGCSALLALALGLTSYAGSAVDTDLDGVDDLIDNCWLDPNGPSGDNCATQQDGDGDGYGNACDTDVDNNGGTNLADVSATLTQSKAGGTLLNFDFDCNGGTNLSDVSVALSDSKAGAIPGPACGNPFGTPCP